MTLVLVVDDEEDLRVLARIHLERAGFQVEEADSGAAALDAIAASKPDAVLLDLRLPGIDGWGVLQELAARDLLDSTAVIVVSAHSDAAMAAQARARGASGYVTKPFTGADLVAAVQRAVTA